MTSFHEWFFGVLVATLGLGPWLLYYYLRAQRLAMKTPVAPTQAPALPCSFHLTDGRRCLAAVGHWGSHRIGSDHPLCIDAITVRALGWSVACERRAGHLGPHCGVDDKGLLRLFCLRDNHTGRISDAIREVPTNVELMRELAQAVPSDDNVPVLPPSES